MTSYLKTTEQESQVSPPKQSSDKAPFYKPNQNSGLNNQKVEEYRRIIEKINQKITTKAKSYEKPPRKERKQVIQGHATKLETKRQNSVTTAKSSRRR